MTIHWYPGHMHKAQKDMIELLPQVDLLIEILDARIPYSSENPAIARLRGDTPCIKVLSKSDLADPAVTALWQARFEEQRNVKTFPTRSDQPTGIKALLGLCRAMFPARDPGKKQIHAMVVGIPNVGKSTLINILAGRTIAKTGNEPAVTKSQQRIDLGNDITLFDTPGILWPKVESTASSYRLAVTGAIRDTAMEYDDVAHFAAEFLLRHYPALLMERFKLDALPRDEEAFLQAAALKRGAISPGGKFNRHKISELLVKEFRSGILGRISLETPVMIAQEQIGLDQAAARQAADKAARKQRFKEGSLSPDKKERKEQRTDKQATKVPKPASRR
ncbi:MAG TPA: ribosome biogenesis GTPase YlqF [Dokdonella sp.]|uniref:ribosome biogenesis GTPase YlqF n=1 Tax=Dokdonella sp. TaxID=2291710 RepID=UPI002C9B21EA|nr:ribosome biogenesis GTPase YlqF [Dokdonella sp.]HOX72714.1 ribosome biogenesis GTPase YlqF [Dokdonella sp.]